MCFYLLVKNASGFPGKDPDLKYRYIGKILSGIGESLAELVFPSEIYCIACGRPIDPGGLYSLCEECIMQIRWANGKVCELCGKPLEDWYPDTVCSECKGSDRFFSGGVTCFAYRPTTGKIIKRLKYGGESYIGRIIGEILSDSIRARGLCPDIIVPVPMYYRKERRRGYNQAELIAVSAAGNLGVLCSADVLKRVRATRPMSRLNRKERRKNLDGAFSVTEKGKNMIRNRRVMLVDDVFTTGTTMDCCAEILLKSGAVCVFCASAAAGFNQKEIPDSDIYLHDA